MAGWYSQRSGPWSATEDLWNSAPDGSGAWGIPVDGDSAVVQAGHAVEVDVDQSDWIGMIQLRIDGANSGAPGMVYFKYDAPGTYCLKFRSGTYHGIRGSNVAVKGRLLANSDGVWGNTGALPFDRKAWINLNGTATLDQTHLDVALYCTRPQYESVRTYGNAYPVTVVVANNRLDLGTLPPSNGTQVCIASTGTMPEGLDANAIYYVRERSGNTCKLALQNNNDTIVTITSAGTGTITLYTGYTTSVGNTVNVVEDVTTDPTWVTGAVDGNVVLANWGPATYDQQRVYLTAIAPGALTLSANVDSDQRPFARVFLASRNVRITGNSASATQPIVRDGTGGVYDCEVRETSGTGTTFQCYGFFSCSDVDFRGSISGCSIGLYSCPSALVSGSVSGCSNGIHTCTSASVSGHVSGCGNGIYSCPSVSVSGQISGCYIGLHTCESASVSGQISGCYYGLYNCQSASVSGQVSGCGEGLGTCQSASVSGHVFGCNYGLRSCASASVPGSVSWCTYGLDSCQSASVSGSVSGCYYGLQSCASASVIGSVSRCSAGLYNCRSASVSGQVSMCYYGLHTCHSASVSGSVSGCGTGLASCSSAIVCGAVLNNTLDVQSTSYAVAGRGASLRGTTQVSQPTLTSPVEQQGGLVPQCVIYDPVDSSGTLLPGRLLQWSHGGLVEEEPNPPAGKPNGVPAWCHRMTFRAGVDGVTHPVVARFPIYAKGGATVSIDVHAKSSAAPSGMQNPPRVQLVDPNTGAALSNHTMADNTDWQSFTLSATPANDGWLEVRVIGGNNVATTLHFYPELTDSLTPGEGGGATGLPPMIGSPYMRRCA